MEAKSQSFWSVRVRQIDEVLSDLTVMTQKVFPGNKGVMEATG